MRQRTYTRRFVGLAAEPLETRRMLASDPVISELMAINNETLKDQDNEFSDWIELHNPTAESVNLDGWFLTDTPDQLTQWRLPAVAIAPGEYLVVFASGKDYVDPQAALHANFKLSGGGEFLALVATDGTTIKHQYATGFPAQMDDVSYGLASDLTTEVFFVTPTPGAANNDGQFGEVAAPRVSVQRGFYDSPFDVQITSETPQAEIRYTLDGTRPTATHGTIYDGSIHVSSMTNLRVGAFKPGHFNSPVETHSYLFVEDVLTQSKPDGYPDLPAGDYRVAPSAVAFHQDTIRDDFKAIPTISLVLSVEDMFGPAGTYVTGQDNPTSVELIYPDGREGFQIDAGVRQQGGTTRMQSFPKHAFRLKFMEEYGPTKLDFPLFDDSPVTRFDSVILRANAQDGWGNGSAAGQNQLIKDEFARRTQLDMDNPSSHGSWVHLYLNGLYWGMYNMVERPDASFGSEHLGGTKEDWDALNKGQLRDGTTEAWDAMLALTPRGGPDVRLFDEAKVTANVEAIQEYLNIPEFIDYVLIGTYMATEDWLPNNYYAGRRSRDGDGPVDANDPAGQFRFFHWDQEASFLGIGSFKDLPGFRSPVGRIFQLLRLSPEFLDFHGQRLYERLFNGGPLSPEAAAARYQGLVEEVQDAIKGEAIRWGRPPSNLPGWHAEAEHLINDYIPTRRDGIIDQYRRFKLFPQTDAPVYGQQGGRIASTDSLVMSATEGAIYYTLDGSDPRLDDGTVSPAAIQYTGPISLNQNALVRSRALANDEWSARNDAQFFVGDPPPAGAVAITEINYHPSDPTTDELAVDAALQSDDFEFVELYNTTEQSLDLTGAKFANGIGFAFGAFDTTDQPMQIAAHDYAVIVANPSAFQMRYGTDTIRVLGEYTGSLNNGGERVRLEGPLGETWLDFGYNDAALWPVSADGVGATLQLSDADTADPTQYDDFRTWRGSTAHGGTPGRAHLPATGVVINEVLARTGQTPTDSIELYNASDEAVDMGGWFLSDSADNLLKYEIPTGTMIGAGQYFVLDETHFNPNSANPSPNSFALNGARGDDVWLVTSDGNGSVTTFVDDVHFGPARESQSFGRSPNGAGQLAPMAALTLGSENSGPRFGPILISELQVDAGLASPAAQQLAPELSTDDLEFVELVNPTSQAVDLTLWRVRGGIDFDFAPDTELGPSETILVLSFDPDDSNNAARLSAFRAHYGIGETVHVVGGYAGQLRDGGERIALQRPEPLSNTDPTLLAWVLEDEVIYDDVAPWPQRVAGAGHSLTRTAPDVWGNAPTSWTMETATPGVFEFTIALPGDANQDGTFDQRDIELVLQAGMYLTGQGASFEHGDWNGDGTFDQLDIVLALQGGYGRNEQ